MERQTTNGLRKIKVRSIFPAERLGFNEWATYIYTEIKTLHYGRTNQNEQQTDQATAHA